jgi:cbb3-type cytochrome oxidase cytochrome c subunit
MLVKTVRLKKVVELLRFGTSFVIYMDIEVTSDDVFVRSGCCQRQKSREFRQECDEGSRVGRALRRTVDVEDCDGTSWKFGSNCQGFKRCVGAECVLLCFQVIPV